MLRLDEQSLSKKAFNHPGFHRRLAVDREASALISAIAETRRHAYESFLLSRETRADAGGFSLDCAEHLKARRLALMMERSADKLKQCPLQTHDKGG